MTDSRPFHLKQFSLYHHRSTMKVGTDAMILSAWADVQNVNRILDVGAGSGIIALMMAARTGAQVDAVEIDQASAEEAASNFEQSPFSGRLRIFHKDFATFSRESSARYDLIISNPPFFINDLPSENRRKTQARHTAALSYDQLCRYSRQLLNDGGRFCLVLPYSKSKVFLQVADGHGFRLQKRQLIFPKPCKEPNRVNLQLGLEAVETLPEEKFIIRNEDSTFSDQYKKLLGGYYTSIKG